LGRVRADEAVMRGLSGGSGNGKNPIMLSNSFEPMPFHSAA